LVSVLFSKNKKKILKIKKTVILPILCRCETWFLALSKECTLRVFEKGVLRRIFGPQRKEVAGG
jgi:hypothetical protein